MRPWDATDLPAALLALVLAALLWGCLSPEGSDAGEIGRDCTHGACPVWLHCRADVRAAGAQTCELADCYRDAECAEGQVCHELVCADRARLCGPQKLEVLP